MPKTYWARTDSNSANNPALNLTGDGAVEITFVPFGTNGDILLEPNAGSFDPDTQVVIGGTAYSFTFELAATLPTLNRDGAQQVPNQFEGHAVYIVTVQDYPTAGETTRLTFLADDTATQAEMNSFGNGAISLQAIDTNNPGVICFAAGTLILTPEGERPVETLGVGDLVVTADHGPQPVKWASASERVWPGSSPGDIPILFKAGSLGPDAPARDLIVSPQHKVLVDLDGKEVLVPAKGLTALPGVRSMNGRRKIVYHHILFERHEIVFSEGIASESFFPGFMALRMLGAGQRQEIRELVQSVGPPCREVLTVRETRDLAGKPRANERDVTAVRAPSVARLVA